MIDQEAASKLPSPASAAEVITKKQNQGFKRDDLWIEILGSSARSNKGWNAKLGIRTAAEEQGAAVDELHN